VNQHAGLTSAFGLQYPHLAEAEEVTGLTQGAGPDGAYGIDDTSVSEETIIDAEGFQTLQFNSLCIRRPEARGKAVAHDAGDSPLQPSTFAVEAPAPSTFDEF